MESYSRITAVLMYLIRLYYLFFWSWLWLTREYILHGLSVDTLGQIRLANSLAYFEQLGQKLRNRNFEHTVK